jgi:hypothetical protein
VLHHHASSTHHPQHVCGDAAAPDDLAPVLAGASIEAIIVLGTSASQSLNPHSCDLRVLSILLLLRHLHSVAAAVASAAAAGGDSETTTLPRRKPVHIIGENQEDMTSVLALPPRPAAGQEAGHDPDFVNTQATMTWRRIRIGSLRHHEKVTVVGTTPTSSTRRPSSRARYARASLSRR